MKPVFSYSNRLLIFNLSFEAKLSKNIFFFQFLLFSNRSCHTGAPFGPVGGGSRPPQGPPCPPQGRSCPPQGIFWLLQGSVTITHMQII